MFVGEAPGEEEDRTGRPFVGKAGQLLTKILQSVGLKRRSIYYQYNKVSSPGNRTPAQSEMDSCFPYLEAQIAIINPSIIITLGGTSTLYLLGKKNLSANFGVSGLIGEEEKIFPMFHPSFLLRYNSRQPGSPRYLTWKDIQEVKRTYDLLKQSS